MGSLGKKIFPFPAEFTAEQNAHISGVHGSAAALVIADFFSTRIRPSLVVCSNAKQAANLAADLQFFFSIMPGENSPELLSFPGWEFSPYRKLLPSLNSRFERLRVLHRLQTADKKTLIVTSIQALSQRTMGHSDFTNSTLLLSKDTDIELLALLKKLPALGYQKTDPVEDTGSYHMRGGILDIFSPALQWPVRIDLFDVQIEQLRLYNPITQRSFTEQAIREFPVVPVREMLLDSQHLEAARRRIKEWSDDNNIPKQIRDRITDPLSHEIVTQEMDYLFPFFHEKSENLWNYLPVDAQWIWVDKEASLQELEKNLQKQNQQFALAVENQEIAAPPDRLFASCEEILAAKEKFFNLTLAPLDLLNIGTEARFSIPASRAPVLHEHQKEAKRAKKSANLDLITKGIQHLQDQGDQVIFVANSQSQLDRLAFLLNQRGIKCAPLHAETVQPRTVTLALGNIQNGFLLPQQKIAFFSEDDVFGQKVHSSGRGGDFRRDSKLAVNPLDDLAVDDLVVHVDHGIGRYKGLLKLSPGGVQGDYVFLEYAGSDKLYLPIYKLETIQKYISGGAPTAALDKLGLQQFAKTKEKVKEAIKDIAAGLLKIHAERALKKGHAFSEPDEVFREFEASFPYDETSDQLKAIQDTIADMCSSKPMDRLVCGDVGFGKTEVAIRAAFKAAQDGKQTAVLVPTTILAEQHYQTFQTRLKDQAIRVASLSRFRSKQEQKKILEELKAGKIDIIIGTHRLLSKDVGFSDLGLMVIDEEQRFGVEHKEKLKTIRATTDVLTLTATPIPRTLHLALIGLRDISIIHTPPTNRLSIRTHLATFDREVIRNAIETELSRGGQVFFIHNRVQSIPSIFQILTETVPNAKIAVGHGQMPESELEKVMLDFYEKRADILLATTIIENGLDVPNANTIVVNRADTFGLAQLYQIRGRVGRSHARAHAYLLVPETAAITDDARERLSILQRFTELGSGYAIASHDLELRGGGDILGEAQSGHINLVGYDLYLELLEEEILRLKGEEKKRTEDVEIQCPFPAFLPDSYVPDPRSRLNLYKRLSNLLSEEDIQSAEEEMLDRYGPLPLEAQELLWLLRIKVVVRRLGFKAITIGKRAITLAAGSQLQVRAENILELIQKQPQKFSVTPDQKLTIRDEYLSLKSVYDNMRHAIQSFASL